MTLLRRIVDNVVAVAAAPLFIPDRPCRNGPAPWTGGPPTPVGNAAFAVTAADFLSESVSEAGRLGDTGGQGLGPGLARQVAGDLTAARAELDQWARSRGITLPPAPPLASPLPGDQDMDALEERWLIRMLAAHDRAIERFQGASRSEDADLAAFATRWSAMLTEHLRMARHLLEARGVHKGGRNHRTKE